MKFDMSKINLYFIKDLVSGAPLTGPIPQINDVIAIRSLKKMLENDDKMNADEVTLVHVCTMDSNSYKLLTNNYYTVCKGKDIDEYLAEKLAEVTEDSDLEE